MPVTRSRQRCTGSTEVPVINRCGEGITDEHVDDTGAAKVGEQHHDPGGVGAYVPDAGGAFTEGVGVQGIERGRLVLGADHGDELSLVGHVQRVDAQDVTGPVDRRVHRQRGFVEHDGQVGGPSQFVAHRPHASPGRVVKPAGRGSGVQEVGDERPQRGRVGPQVGFEGQVAPGQHDGHTVIGDGP